MDEITPDPMYNGSCHADAFPFFFFMIDQSINVFMTHLPCFVHVLCNDSVYLDEINNEIEQAAQGTQ